MKVTLFEVEDWERAAFGELEADHEVRFHHEALDEDTLGDALDAEVISTFIYSRVEPPVLDRFQNLKLIATRSTGFDHIDLDYCSKRNIRVANVPVYGDNTVAEHVFALLGAISHHLVEAVDRTRRGDFSQQGLTGFDLQGKTIGIVGTGNIGRVVARIARGYDMTVFAFDVAPDEDAARELGFRYVELDELLARSDIITLHVPGNEKTKDLISNDQFAKMKDGVVLINTARGTVVNVQALLRGLSTGKVRAAGLDVLPEEPVIREEAEVLRSYFHKEHNLDTLLANHILLRMKNVIITPHSAFNTREAVQRILDTTRDNIVAFARNKPMNIVN